MATGTKVKKTRKLRPERMTDAQKVEKGMKLLDEIFGPEWVLLIDLDTFNIGAGNRCVLGQIGHHGAGLSANSVSSPYHAVMRELANMNGPVQDFLFEHFVWPEGLHAKYHLINDACGFSGSVENEKWVRAIKKRQDELGGEAAVLAARQKWTKGRRRVR